MINVNVNSPYDLRNAGMQILIETLGPIGFTRFIQQFQSQPPAAEAASLK